MLLRWFGRQVFTRDLDFLVKYGLSVELSCKSPYFSVLHFRMESVVLLCCDIANHSAYGQCYEKMLWSTRHLVLSSTPGIQAAKTPAFSRLASDFFCHCALLNKVAFCHHAILYRVASSAVQEEKLLSAWPLQVEPYSVPVGFIHAA